MTIKRFLQQPEKINFHIRRCVVIFLLSIACVINFAGIAKKQPAIVAHKVFATTNYIGKENHSPTLLKYRPVFFEIDLRNDSVPVPKHRKHKTVVENIQIPMVTVIGRRSVLDSGRLVIKDTIGNPVKLSWQLAGTDTAAKTVTDSIGRAFFNYIDKYYHLDNFEHLVRQLDSGLLNGHVNISVAAQKNIDTVKRSKINAAKDTAGISSWNSIAEVDSSNFNIPSLGATYLVDSQQITVHYPELSIHNFVVQDAAHHKLVASGGIVSTSAGDELNLKIDAKNFTLLNVQKAIANQLYGFASVDAVATVSGSTVSPVINGNIMLNDNTDVTIILPQNNANKEAENSMVRFIDRDTFALPEIKQLPHLAPVKPLPARLLNYNFNIVASPRAALTFILDPSNGDELKLYGDAKLKAGIDSTGKLVLDGLYKLDSGYYTLNYQFFQKQFKVLPGSAITFQGAPADAQINITAVYRVTTFAKELLENEVGLVDAQIAKSFKKNIPFKVLLKLNGPIKNPTISFDIEMPDSSVQVNKTMRIALKNKLDQLKENIPAINKQVFSLLLYNRFVGEQSTDFFKGSGTGDGGRFDDLSHESVSKFLSSALDNIAADLFKTLDVYHDLDNYRDYGNGDAQQKTEIKIGATKSFINDRLSLNVGKNYGIDGQDASAKAAQQKGVGFLPDVTLNYKFTKDGKYRYRSYKKNQFEVVVDGYVTESGVSLMIILDYDKFSELLNRK